MADFPKLLASFVLITLFAFLIIIFATQLADDYNKDTSEIEERLNIDDITAEVNQMEETAEGWSASFKEFGEGGIFETILDVIGFLSVGVLRLTQSMFLFITAPFRILQGIMSNVLGIPTIVTQIIWVLIILTMIFGIWRLVRAGQ